VDRMSTRGPGNGLTLIELLLALVVLCVAVTLASPLLGSLLAHNRLEADAKRLLGALRLARSEAVQGNGVVSVCPARVLAGSEPRCAGSYRDGWIVYANRDRGAQRQPATDRLLGVFAGLPPGYRVTNRRDTRAASSQINYLPDGTTHRNLTLQICPPRADVAPLSIVLNSVGRARLQRDWGTCTPGM